MNDDVAGSGSERWRVVWDHFHRLTELDEAGRRAYLERVAGDDAEMAEELRTLLEGHETPNPVLDRPEDLARRAFPTSDGEQLPDPRIGRRIGPYRLVDRLGEGGMGIVYLGERVDEQVRQRVAIKLLSEVGQHPTLIERFRHEREILAHLEHPSIARLIDVGDDSDGRPYVIMEYVDGEPIDVYCDRKGLGLRQRVELVLEVCAAVDAAHRSLVVHRDIKPSNVLVTEDGVAKLVDFGIARRLDAGDVTFGASSAFTPRWASPEQLGGEPVTTAADIYSLGLLLCHLLTGQLPYRQADASLPLLAREVLEQTPLRPSSLVAGRSDTFLPATTLSRRLRGDLDAVILHALERRPTDRYHTAADLAADLRRYLDGFPITARPPGPAERLRKLFRRHPWTASAITALAATVLIFATSTTLLNVRLSRSLERLEAERANTNRQREVALQTAGFLQDLFRSVTPARARGEEPTVRQIVDAGASRLLADDSGTGNVSPSTRVELLLTLSEVYASLSDFDEASRLAQRAEAIAEELDQPDLTASVAVTRGRLHHTKGEYGEATARFESAIEVFERSDEKEVRSQLPSALSDLGAAHIALEQLADAEEVLHRALLLFGDVRSQSAAVARLRLGSLKLRLGELEPAGQLLEEAVRDLGSAVGSDHPATVGARRELADALRRLGDEARAISVLEAALADAERVYGPDHANLATILDRLSLLHQARGELETAEALQRRALAIREEQFGPDSPKTVIAVNNLGWLLHDFGRYDEAGALYRRALESGERGLGRDHPSVAISLNNIGLLALDRGRYEEAEGALERSLTVLTARLGEEHPSRAFPLTNLGRAHLERGHLEEAERLLREALDLRRRRLPPGHDDLTLTLGLLGRLLCETERTSEGEALVQEALEIEQAKGRSGSFGEALLELELGACLLAGAEREQALPLLRGALPRIETRRGSDDPLLARGKSLLADG